MKIGKSKQTTRVLGEEQGYVPMPVADIPLTDGTPCMYTVWHPSPGEIRALSVGGCIILGVLGTEHPPVVMYVTDDQDTFTTEEEPN